jgi:hypothetical protein
MPQKYQPDYPYLRHVRISRVHLFTVIQICALVGMFAVKNIKSIAITFPLLVDKQVEQVEQNHCRSICSRWLQRVLFES